MYIIQFIHPPAAGGGTPEVMAFLNGIIVHGSLSLKNLVIKFTSNVFAVSSGLPTAIQAPIITYGSVYSWARLNWIHRFVGVQVADLLAHMGCLQFYLFNFYVNNDIR